MRGGMEQYLTPMGPTKLHVNPIFEISPLEPRFSEWLVFEGLSIDEHGRQHFLDASVAYKRAVLNCIHYLSKFGYTKQQVSKCLGQWHYAAPDAASSTATVRVADLYCALKHVPPFSLWYPECASCTKLEGFSELYRGFVLEHFTLKV